MSRLHTVLLIRHGETDGESSIRFHGTGDVALSEEGGRQMREAARRLPIDHYDLVVASPLRRAWESARIVAGGAPVQLETGFREIDFGRWEGLTREEIRERDPILYEDWQSRAEGFELPGGEKRSEFRARVHEGVERLRASGARTVLVVAHKGVIRTIVEHLTGEPFEEDVPLGGAVQLSFGNEGRWIVGRRPSNPVAG